MPLRANSEDRTLSMTSGAPERGQPGGHIGARLVFASCTRCRVEWVWIAAGLPNSMRNCGCPDDAIVVVNFVAESHGRLDRRAS